MCIQQDFIKIQSFGEQIKGEQELRRIDEFMSFNRSPESGGSEASNPEREFSNHFDLEDLEIEELNQALQDSSAEDKEPVSAAAQLIPDPEQVV